MSSSPAAVEPTRRSLSVRQAATVQRLTDATVKEVRAKGLDGLTVRGVARRAGVAAATAYTYFGSKEHLVCEAFWRKVQELPGPSPELTSASARRSAAAKVTNALADLAQLASDEPALVAAVTVAMVADDPDVKRLRDRVGGEIHRRFVAALGPQADPDVLDALDLAMSGAMIRAGTGHMSHSEIPGRMAKLAGLLTR
jgi:AcrR family transcriptional regulator